MKVNQREAEEPPLNKCYMHNKGQTWAKHCRESSGTKLETDQSQVACGLQPLGIVYFFIYIFLKADCIKRWTKRQTPKWYEANLAAFMLA